MTFITLIFSYLEYLAIRFILLKYTKIELDIFPDRYYDNPKKTWLGAGIFITCFLITGWIVELLFGADKLNF
ncbi:hypothetical protein [Cellulosilyticum sp. I15G10I2]|uniref:hypothetical protein n=1 Tax=Cellulosilyticum sp. I15G10I2 TaxID=1892843 RepID=UPI00085C81A3|nr:hypothetical protein [Cellulosilyticum sp. I15G10I2]